MSRLGTFKGNPADAVGYLNPAINPDTVAFHRANLPRIGLADLATVLATGVMTSVPIDLQAGDTVTSLSVVTGATAAGTPTHFFLALYDTSATPALLAQTADQTSTAMAADTVVTLALTAPVKISKSGTYRVGILSAATTPPSLLGVSVAKPVLTGQPALSQSSGSALTATAPATIATPAAVRGYPLVVAS